MLTTIVSALLLVAVVLAPGYAAYRALIAPERPVDDPAGLIERLAVSTVVGVLITGWLALTLVEIGLLHLPLLAALSGAVTAGLVALARRRRRSLALGPVRWAPAETAFVVAALLALLLALRPHQMVLGGTDAGVYANTGANIARTGRLLIDDRVTASLAPTARGPRATTDTPDDAPPAGEGAIRHLMLRLPEGRFPFADYLRLAGFYVLDLPSGTLTPQFLHLYPTWLGLFGRALGDEGLFFATPILGWLGAVMAGLVGRRLFGPWVGAVTVLLLGLNSLQIWFVRHSLSEALLQLLLCTTAYGWAVAHEGQPERGVAEQRSTGAEGQRDEGRGTRRQASVMRSEPPTPASPRPSASAPVVSRSPALLLTSPPHLLLAGTALGSLSLAHAQFVFAFGLLPPLAVWLWLSRRWERAYWAFFGPVLVLTAHAALHIAVFALGYFEGLYHHIILDLWRDRARASGVLGLVMVTLAVLNWSRDWWWPRLTEWSVTLTWPARRRAAAVQGDREGLAPANPPGLGGWGGTCTAELVSRVLLTIAVGMVLAYAYLVRPGIIGLRWPLDLARLAGYIGAPVTTGPQANLVRLGWYLSPLGMLLAGVGAVAIVARLRSGLLLLLGFTAVYGLAFNLASFTHESYIYSLRRFVPIVLPFLSLAAAYAIVIVVPGLVALGRAPVWRVGLGRLASVGALGALVLFFAVTGRTIINHVEHEGMREQVATIAANFAPTDIILFAGDRDEPHKLATPLRFFFGLDALVVSTNNPRGDLIDTWVGQQIAEGRRVRVALGNNGGKLLLPNYRLEPVGTLSLTMRELERLADQKPFNIQTNRLEYTLYDVQPAAGAPLTGPPYRYQTGPGDELASVIGWYGRETDPDGEFYRWTNGDALLRLPWPASRGPMRLRLHLAGGTRPSALGPARLELALARGQNDRTAPAVGTLQLVEGFATYEVAVPPTLLPDQPTATVMLALRNRAWQPSEYGPSADPRALGVKVAWVELVAG